MQKLFLYTTTFVGAVAFELICRLTHAGGLSFLSFCITLTLILTLTLSACSKREPPPTSSSIYGPMTATGTISATGASLYRRGTHVLLMDGQTRFFLESPTVGLGRFDSKEVKVQGELELNTHPSFLPV